MQRYGNALSRRASWLFSVLPALRSKTTVEDLVQGFLADKVLPNREAFFGKVARGQAEEFLALIRTSLKRYAMDIVRRREIWGNSDNAVTDNIDARWAASLFVSQVDEDIMAETERRYRRLMSIIHGSRPYHKNVVHYLAVLLTMRLHLVQGFGESTVDLSRYGI
jgi:hypothetical protein